MARITIDGTGRVHAGTVADLRARLDAQPAGSATRADAELEAAQSRTDAARDGMIARLRFGWQTAGTNRGNVKDAVHNLATDLRG